MRVYPAGSSEEDFDDNEIPDYSDEDYYRTDQTEAEVAAILHRIKECVRKDRFAIAEREGQDDNTGFLYEHGLFTRNAQKRFLLAIDVSDFCHAIRASDGNELYVFCVRHATYGTANGESVLWVYVKHRCLPSGNPFDYVISLHELKYPIDLLFVD